MDILVIHSLYIPYIYIFVNMFHIFSLVCFSTYGVKSRSGHGRSQSFGQFSHVSGPKLSFWGNLQMIMHGFAARVQKTLFVIKITWCLSFSGKNDAESSRNFVKNLVLDPKRAKLDQKSEHGHVHHVPKAPSEGEIIQEKHFFFFETT